MTFTSACLLQQILGWSYFRGGYGDGTRAGGPGPDLERMEADWREHRDVILDEHRQSWRHARLRPWAWWRFERGFGAPPSGAAEGVALHQIGQLTRGDLEALRSRIAKHLFLPADVKRLEALTAGAAP